MRRARADRALAARSSRCVAGAAVGCGGRSRTAGPARHRPRLRRAGLRADARADGRSGRLPNFARLAAAGGVRAARHDRSRRRARSPGRRFITGLDPGGHGIFDFIHRDPKTMVPYLSTTQDRGRRPHARRSGDWQFPLSGGTVELLRQRPAVLGGARGARHRDDDHPHAGELPAVRHGDARAERHGHAGHPRHLRHVLVLHLRAVRVRRPDAVRRRGRTRSTSRDGVVRAHARRARQSVPRDAGEGARADSPRYLDASQPVREARRRRRGAAAARSASGATGCRSSFALVPTQSLRGEVPLLPEAARAVLRAVRQPAQHRSVGAGDAVSTPATYAAELAAATGRFYTQGMPEDTKGLKTGVLTRRRVPRAGAPRRRREPAAVPLRARSVHAAACSSTTSATSIRSRT